MSKQVYDAFRAAGVPDDSAAAAAEAIEATREEGRLRKIDEGLIKLDGRVTLLAWIVGFNMALTAAVLAKLLAIH
jgi:hypothetical protein